MTSARKLRSVKTQTRGALVSISAGARQLRKTRELAAASSETIRRRTALINKAIQTGKGLHNPEFDRMGTEKLKVMFDSWRATRLRAPALNRLLMQHWGTWMHRSMASAAALASCRSPNAAAAIGFNATAAMVGDLASLNLALIRLGQQLSEAAATPVHRVATGNARRLASSAGRRSA